MSSENQELISAMKAQTDQLAKLTQSIRAMTMSNQQVIALLTEVVSQNVEDGDGEPMSFLDGRAIDRGVEGLSLIHI